LRRYRFEHLLQTQLPGLRIHETDLGSSQVTVGGQEVEPCTLGALAYTLDRDTLEQEVVGGEFDPVLVDTDTGRGIALRVEIDQQDTGA